MNRSRSVAAFVAGIGLLAGCIGGTPSKEKLSSVGSVAVVARLEPEGPVSRICEDGAIARMLAPENMTAAEADSRISKKLEEYESIFKLETRFRGEFLDHLGKPPPFEVAPPGVMDTINSSLLAKDVGPPNYRKLVDAGVGAVLEISLQEVTLAAPSGSRPAGVKVRAKARLIQLPDESTVWSSSVEAVPETGTALAITGDEFKADPARAYLTALGAAAKAIGGELAADLTGAPWPPQDFSAK